MLFLDLRLFSSRAKEEFAFFQRLASLAEQAKEGTNGLRWPGFSEADIDAVKECARTQTSETEKYYIALTFLPRLIALVDPFLPIVLFSSTGQKHVVDRLSRYGTITLDFDKPRFFGDPSKEVVSETKVRFVRAVKSALRIARGRYLVQTVSALASSAIPKNPPPSATTERRLVEFYFDETGTPGAANFQVGGLAILYPNAAAASEFSAALRDAGLFWGWDRDNPWEACSTVHRPLRKLFEMKRTYRDKWEGVVKSHLGKLVKLAATANLWIAQFSLTWPTGASASMPWGGPDQIYRALLRDAIEVLLFDWLPTMIEGKNFDVGVYVATRRWDARESILELLSCSRIFGVSLREESSRYDPPDFKVFDGAAPDFGDIAAKVATAEHAYAGRDNSNLQLFVAAHCVPPGISTPGRDCNDLLAFSFTFDDVHPLLSDIATERSDTSLLEDRLFFAAGVKLTYYTRAYQTESKATPHQLPRQVHYAADWLVGNTELMPLKARQTIELFSETRDQAFLSLLNASRLADWPGREAEALQSFYMALREKRPMRQLVAPRLAACARRLVGRDFVRLCELVSTGP
jgi:hypothetical protein